MKTIILCGGKGTRLHEKTEDVPKPMVEIGGQPILWHIMNIYASYGYKDFILCLGYKKDYVFNYLENNNLKEKYGFNINAIDTGLDAPKGQRINMVKEHIDGEPFMMTYGDGVANINIDKLILHHVKNDKISTFTGVHPPSRFATIELDKNNNITSWKEKHPIIEYVNGGFFIFKNKIFYYLKNNEELEEGPMEKLVKDGQAVMYPHEGYWESLDTYRDYLSLNKKWSDGKALWKTW